jgi:alkyl hydroperoxide reductase subunit AhpC
VFIIEKETGKVVASLTIVIQGLNYTPSDQEYFSAAWREAVGDKLVDAYNPSKYNISF